jgi:uncharacterized protein (DUF2141 family)
MDNYFTANYSITVKINGIKTSKGLIFITLYSSSVGFPSDNKKAIRSLSVDAVSPATEAVFKDLPPGTYAMAVMHDENNNGKMDKNFLGIPTEGYCVSNNAKGFMSAPSFDHAKFELHQEVKQELNMIY